MGTVDEDWAIESMAGDIFLLGKHILAHPAHREPALCACSTRMARRRPFRSGCGEAPAARDELSTGGLGPAKGARVADLARAIRPGDAKRAPGWVEQCGLELPPRRTRSSRYVWAPRTSIPGRRIARPTGRGRVRAFLRRLGRHAARRPRAVRWPDQPQLRPRAAQELLPQTFDFELQAAANDDAIVLSTRSAAQLPAGRCPRI